MSDIDRSLSGSSTSIRVPDMACDHCAATIRGAIESALPGAAIRIDQDSKVVSVDGAEVARLREIVTRAGYTPEAG